MVNPVLFVGEIPRPVISPQGLYSVATLVDVERPLVYGVDVEVPSAGGHGTWEHGCLGEVDNSPKRDNPDGLNRVNFPGTTVWAAVECAEVGMVGRNDKTAALAKLRAIEGAEVEGFTAGVILDREPENMPSVAAAEAALLRDGLQPVVHVAPRDVPALLQSKFITATGGTVRTLLGSPVSIGAGYEFEPGVVAVTGPVTVWRNTPDSFDNFDVENNMRLAVAERPVAVGWAGGTYVVNLSQGAEG